MTAQPNGDNQTIGNVKCTGFSYALTGSYKEKGKKKDVTYTGKAWLDSGNGTPVKIEYTQKPLPSMAKTMTTNLTYKFAPDGKCYPTDMLMDASGGFLFIKKRFRLMMTFSDYWKSKTD